MKILTIGLIIISTLVTSSITLPPSTVLQASSKGLKLYLAIETNLNDDVRINTYQYGDRVHTHNAVIHSGSNEVTLQYPSGLIDTGEFRVCISAIDFDKSACGNAYNSEAKQPEHVYINLFADDIGNTPNVNSQAQSQPLMDHFIKKHRRLLKKVQTAKADTKHEIMAYRSF